MSKQGQSSGPGHQPGCSIGIGRRAAVCGEGDPRQSRRGTGLRYAAHLLTFRRSRHGVRRGSSPRRTWHERTGDGADLFRRDRGSVPVGRTGSGHRPARNGRFFPVTETNEFWHSLRCGDGPEGAHASETLHAARIAARHRQPTLAPTRVANSRPSNQPANRPYVCQYSHPSISPSRLQAGFQRVRRSCSGQPRTETRRARLRAERSFRQSKCSNRATRRASKQCLLAFGA